MSDCCEYRWRTLTGGCVWCTCCRTPGQGSPTSSSGANMSALQARPPQPRGPPKLAGDESLSHLAPFITVIVRVCNYVTMPGWASVDESLSYLALFITVIVRVCNYVLYSLGGQVLMIALATWPHS
jgi:hypothetical protein